MKTLKATTSLLRFLAILLITMIISSCGKDGATGPKGDTGAVGNAGAQGAQGAQGIPGKDGAMILNGNGIPTATIGNNGDMYLDKSSSNLYGPKTAAGWGMPLNLKGETGATGAIGNTGVTGVTGAAGATGQNGANGSTILSGNNAPTVALGINGDYYLNKANADFYGPKTNNGWGTPVNLRGSANVIASSWMNLKTWTNNGLNFYRDIDYTIPSPILNAVGYSSLGEMLDRGGVLIVYFNYINSTYQVPTTIVTVSPKMIVNWQVAKEASSNSFLFSVYGENNAALNPDLINNPGNGSYRLRYVLIPAGSQIAASSNLKNMKYAQVSKLLGLQDE